MKLADESLLQILDIFRKGIIEGCDCSQLLRDLQLEAREDGKLYLERTGVQLTSVK